MNLGPITPRIRPSTSRCIVFRCVRRSRDSLIKSHLPSLNYFWIPLPVSNRPDSLRFSPHHLVFGAAYRVVGLVVIEEISRQGATASPIALVSLVPDDIPRISPETTFSCKEGVFYLPLSSCWSSPQGTQRGKCCVSCSIVLLAAR